MKIRLNIISNSGSVLEEGTPFVIDIDYKVDEDFISTAKATISRSKDYINSEIEVDILESFLGKEHIQKHIKQFISTL